VAAKKLEKADEVTSAAADDAAAVAMASGSGGPDHGWHVSLGTRLGNAARWATDEADGVVIAARRAAGVTRRVLGGQGEPLAPLVGQLAKLIEARKADDYASLETDLEFWSLVKRLNHRGAVLTLSPPGGTAKPANDVVEKKKKKKKKPEGEPAEATVEAADAEPAPDSATSDGNADADADADAEDKDEGGGE